jgi:hypothetical protein
MPDLTPQQTSLLEGLIATGFAIVAFPMYASAIGVRRGDCAALLVPVTGGGLKLQGEPCYVVNGNLAVAIFRGERKLYVWKKTEVAATPEREAELKSFRQDLVRQIEAGSSPPAS